MCPVFAVRGIGRQCGCGSARCVRGCGQAQARKALPMRRGWRRTHRIDYRKGLPVSVGSEPGFPLEHTYVCPAGRVRESRCETALPMLRGRQWGTDQRAGSGNMGLSCHSAPAKGIKTAPAVWGQTLFGFRLCLGIYRGLGVLIVGLPGHGVKIRTGRLIRCRSLGQFRGGS